MATFIDLHILQNLPPSCVNRDDSGSPKSAIYGGVRRLRVSSQSWKRATRLYFGDHLKDEEVGVRTKQVVEYLADYIRELSPDLEEAPEKLAAAVFTAAKIKVNPPRNNKDGVPQSGYLLFLSTSQLTRLAHLAIQAAEAGEKVDAKIAKEILKTGHAVDVSLFGRMVADDADLNVDAACQVAHAISTHPVENEYDFFTAVDDVKAASDSEDAGAGMMGTVEFASATMYRYSTINFDLLRANLGSNDAALRALEVFIQGFSLAMPTGKQNTFANNTLPHLVVATVRTDQPVSFVSAFEQPIRQDSAAGYLGRSVERLAKHAQQIETAFGLRPLHAFVAGLADEAVTAPLGQAVTFTELSGQVKEAVSALIAGQEQD